MVTLGQVGFFAVGAHLELKLKAMWAALDESRKAQRTMESFVYELPVPLFIVNDQNRVVLQNYLSYKLLPKGNPVMCTPPPKTLTYAPPRTRRPPACCSTSA